jgi:tRNA threonylcarbamoyladenosine biosynthesis protein TsaB
LYLGTNAVVNERSAGRWLILETSGRRAEVAVADASRVRAAEALPEARRHARDLAAVVGRLAADQGWKVRELTRIVVSRGPGSYTGLRVGIVSAKTLAYAVGCELLAADTFAVIAEQAPAEAAAVDVLADAQQENVYVQRFRRDAGAWATVTEIAVRPLAAWRGGWSPEVWLSGPGVDVYRPLLPEDARLVPDDLRRPAAATMHAMARDGRPGVAVADPWKLEPLYLRGSYAEEQAKRLAGR